MKVCVIGDIHGTTKFLDCYMDILKNDNDCEKIIVLGDHFDPYENITVDELIEKYNEFIDICKKDDRIISILGNHDLSTYIINDDCTNRTERNRRNQDRIGDVIKRNLPDGYLVYKIGNYLFSHAGVSQVWLDDISRYEDCNYAEKIMNNTKGWNVDELSGIVYFRYIDDSGYGDNEHQGCTWIRPHALDKCAVKGYNQVVGHTQVKEITKVQMENGMDLWLTDNCRKSEYLVLNIEESE